MLLAVLNLPFRLGCQHGANPVGQGASGSRKLIKSEISVGIPCHWYDSQLKK